MTELNKSMADCIRNFDIHACTDVTGFGLLGHLIEVLKASKVSADLWMDQVPIIDGAESIAAGGVIPGGTKNNLAFVEQEVEFGSGISDLSKLLLADAQTSGGLLFCVGERQLNELMQRSKELNRNLFPIGKIKRKSSYSLSVQSSKKKS
jgi:selenide,water dikinase